MAASAGRVLLIPKGTYNAATTYNMLDVVYYNGGSYVCKQTSLNNLPTDTDYWQLLVSSSGTAAQVSFDPTGTDLLSTNVQDVVVEVRNNISNPNLLINPWFTVNQRGQNGVLATDAYGVDRWAGGSGTATVKTGQVYGGSIYQRNSDFTSLVGKTITLSAIVNGSVVSGTAVLNSNSFQNFYDDTHVNLSMDTRNSQPTVRIVVNSKNNADVITAVKLELGSVSTLALDTAPDYTTELLKCQRYYTRLAYPQYGYIAVVAIVSNHEGVGVLPLPTMMRTTPTLTYSGSFSFVLGDGTQKSVYQMIIHGEAVNSIGVVFSDNSSVGGLTAGQAAFIYAPSTGAYIELDAELEN